MAVEVSREGAVAVVTVNRPEALNALNSETRARCSPPCASCRRTTRCAPSSSPAAGEKAFVAGADIAEMSGLTAEQARRFGALVSPS